MLIIQFAQELKKAHNQYLGFIHCKLNYNTQEDERNIIGDKKLPVKGI